MNQIVTKGIVLGRIDYGEADRIITLLTPDQGKLRLMAKGVRRVKSKLAGGIELFSVSQVTFIRGRGDIGTLVSTRLDRHYSHIVADIRRVQLGYDLLKLTDKSTEDEPEAEYFYVLEHAFEALDDATIDTQIIRLWFQAQLLKQAGHTPNFTSDTSGKPLRPDKRYQFSFDDMTFQAEARGLVGASEIKCLRLFFGGLTPKKLQQVQGASELLVPVESVVRPSFDLYIRR